MTTLYAFDGATPWTDDANPSDRSRLQKVKRAGGIAVSVYIVGRPGGMRPAIKRDVTAARDLNLGVLPNWERAADFFRTATLADCRQAGREALDACQRLGFPDDGSIGVPFSFDYQVPLTQYQRATDQLHACGDGMGGRFVPLGYGQIGLIDYWAAHGLPGPHWLMGSTWRGTSRFYVSEVRSPNVAMVQSHTADGEWLNSPVPGTDVNTLTQPARLRAWWPDGHPYAQGDTVSAQDVIAALNDPKGVDLGADGTTSVSHILAVHHAWLQRLLAASNPAAVAAAVVAKLPKGTGSLTEADVEAAVRAVFADAGSAQ